MAKNTLRIFDFLGDVMFADNRAGRGGANRAYRKWLTRGQRRGWSL